MYGLKWSYGQILQSPLLCFAAPSGLSLVSLLPLINALLAWSEFWWAALPWQVCCGALFLKIYILDLMVLREMFKVSDVFLQSNPDLYFSTTLSLTCLESSLVFMVPLVWWCPLLCDVTDSGAFQKSCIYMLRSCDRSCDT